MTALRTIFPKNAAFASTHWPRRSLLHHGPVSRFEPLLRAPELASPRALFEASARAGSEVELWSDREGEEFRRAVVSPDAAASLFANGLTAGCFRVERYVPAVRELLAALARDLGLPSLVPTCHAYLSSPGARVRPHFDKQENLVVQLSGRKRWQLAENETVAFPHENHVAGAAPSAGLARLSRAWPSAMPKHARTVVMRPGSTLFVPRGMWHATVTVTTSFSLTILLQAKSWAQVLTDGLLERLLEDARFREPASRSSEDLAARRDDFVRAAREVSDARERRYAVAKDARPRLRGRQLEAEGVSIAIERRYVRLIRWILAREQPFVAADANETGTPADEAAGVLSFLEAHGLLRRRS